MELKAFFFAIIIFGMVVVAASISVDQWGATEVYDSGVTSDLQEYHNTEEVSAYAEEFEGQISTQDPDPGTDYEAQTFRGAYGIMGEVFRPFRLVFGRTGMVGSIADRFGIPHYITLAIISMMVFALITTLIAIIFRLSRTNA
jgi:hypothetical protein